MALLFSHSSSTHNIWMSWRLNCVLFVGAAALTIGANAVQEQVVLANGLSPGNSGGDWDRPPHPDDTGHLIFDTVANLFKHWSNTNYRNGHNIVPATIATGTLLYHGTWSEGIPNGPEWVSFDPEHSLMFSTFGSGHLQTFGAERELKVVYLDGSSASNMPSGTIDSQDLIIYDHVTDDPYNERDKIAKLCNWGKKYDIDGFVRMEFDFEMMYCNFKSGLKLISSVAVIPADRKGWGRSIVDFHSTRFTDRPPEGQLPPLPIPPTVPNFPKGRTPWDPPNVPGWAGSLRNKSSVDFEGLQAGVWHNFSPLTGVRPDYSRLISFYDPAYQSLVEWRRTVASRELHRLRNISSEDVLRFKVALNNVMIRPSSVQGSGVDWGQLIRHIVERHADRIDWLRWLLQGVSDSDSIRDEAFNATQTMLHVRQHVLTMLSPYLSTDCVPPSVDTLPSLDMEAPWLAPAIERCSSTYTSHIPTAHFTPSERLLKTAIDQTTYEICRTLGRIWTGAFSAELIPPSSIDDVLVPLLRSWKEEVRRLMEWLGWSIWLKCDPGCHEDEICTIPQWPFDGVLEGDEDITPHCLPRVGWGKLLLPVRPPKNKVIAVIPAEQ